MSSELPLAQRLFSQVASRLERFRERIGEPLEESGVTIRSEARLGVPDSSGSIYPKHEVALGELGSLSVSPQRAADTGRRWPDPPDIKSKGNISIEI